MIKHDTLTFSVSKAPTALSKYLGIFKALVSRIFQLEFSFSSLLSVFFLFFAQNLFAEGSKDLYPNNAQGNRAFLYANVDGTSHMTSWPFKTQGTHFVYAKQGETIAVASSAVGVNNGRIVATAPNGTIYNFPISGNTGVIPDRASELVGPRWSGLPAAGYTPFTRLVGAGEEGVWKVDFVAPIGNGTSDNFSVQDIAATGNWSRNVPDNSTNVISAWDVSVRNSSGTDWLSGRVYANVLNLIVNGGFAQNRSFYTTNYILTEDGRAYRVKTNGNNGYGFTFFSNNNGFSNNGVPRYKSLNFSDYNTLINNIHDPRSLDNALSKTHKIFYNKPNPDLPSMANAFVSAPNQSMWLKKEVVLPTITNLKITGIEGTEGKISKKGAKVTFTSSTSGSYQITIPFPSGTDRVINGVATPGENEVFWDAKDGNGVFLPAGAISPIVQTFLRSAEVHFPYIDMEVNPQGIIIELTENNTNYEVNPSNTNPSEYSDKVYWNDVDISNAGNAVSSNPITNLTGISSLSNGHKFGSYSGNAANHFGDNRSMDTWAYIESNRASQLVNIEILEANLKIESISPDLSQYFSGNKITYTVRVQNDGPSAANGARLAIDLPTGLTITTVGQANASAGVAVGNPTTVGQTYSATLDLPDKGTIDFLVEATFTGSFNKTFSNTKASILRPRDLTDPDATGNNAAGPVDPDEECLNSTTVTVGVCNNIKYNTVNGQEVCQGNSITPITYTRSPDGGTQFENTTPLPAGLSAQNASGNRTVSGALSALGVQDFYIKTRNTNRTQTNVTIRSVALPNATADGPASLCIDETGNPAISFKGSSTTGSYEFSYTVNGGPVQTVTTPAGSDTATVPIPLNASGDFTYRLILVKDLATNCSVVKNVAVTVTIHPLPARANVQLVQ